jgi:crotonobetainyl-CoA:carnitine CoA-transferase CaiB-like acyl-CoA transferase
MVIQGGTAGGPPQFIRIAINDYYAAALGAQGVLAALFTRERTGQGQRVETSLLHASLALQSGSVLDYPGRPIFARENPTYRLYECGDGEWFFLACGNQSFWGKLTKALGIEHLRDDPRFAGWLLRLEHSNELLPILTETFKSKPRADWLKVFAASDIPAAPVQTLAEFMDDPAVRHHGMVQEYDHPDVGKLKLMGQPIKITPAAPPRPIAPPAIDQHTDEVLGELGYDAAAIKDLRTRKVVGATPGAGKVPRVKS